MDGFDLKRFPDAQYPIYVEVLVGGIARRPKPQSLDVVRFSASCLPRTQHYGAMLCDPFARPQAEACFAQPLLGARLEECTAALLAHAEISARNFGVAR